jgi:2-succinyl-5-enolpyruvyl-6-hydroxy-3-cyclohexene-1-carboxylate synthase
MFVDALEQLSTRAGAPVLAEATSQLRCWSGTGALGGFDTFWQTEAGRAACRPDFVLQLGAAPISRGWEQLATSHSLRRIVVHPWAWADPTSSAEAIVEADIGSFLSALSQGSYSTANREKGFVDRLARAEATVWRAAGEILDEAGDVLTEGGVARTLFEALPDPSAVVLGNSLPVRDVETWTKPSRKLLLVRSQRGVSGIDGVVSGAAGVASAVDGPTTLLVGDVSFLHDQNGLQLASAVDGPLVIVVVNNGGGRIFEQLPIASRGDQSWLPFFVTPHDADLASAAATYGCAHRSVRTVGELRGALEAAYEAGGCSVVEAIVPPHSARDQTAELLRRVERALGRGPV